MKKIIATVLAMVMALALCATAFAADLTYYAEETKENPEKGNKTYTFVAAKNPTVNAKGETTAKGNVAYYVEKDANMAYVTVSSLADADKVLYTNSDKKNVVMYLAKVVPGYLKGTAITFGTACGINYEKPDTFNADNTYYVAELNGNDVFFYTNSSITPATTGVEALLVDGKLVNVLRMTSAIKKVAHAAVPTVKDGKIVGYTCSKCGTKAIEAPNFASIPAGAERIGTTLWYFPAAASSTTTTTTGSPKTFDAGIAMYVGMALTSVAGSAVVIGKKKEF